VIHDRVFRYSGGASMTADPRGVLLALACAVSFGVAPAMTRLAYMAGADVFTISTVRFVAGVVGVAGLILVARSAMRLSPRANWGALGLGLISSATSLGYMGAIFYIPASLAVLIFYTFPLFVAVGARWSEGEPLTLTKIVGLLVAFIGLAIALGVTFDGLDPVGVALAGMAAVGAAVHVLAVSPVARWAGGQTLPVSLRSMAVAMVVNLGLLAAQGGPAWPTGMAGWLGFAGATVFFTFGVTLMYATVSRLGPVTTSVLLNLEPLVAIVTAVLLLGEPFGPQQSLGAALVLGAVLWVQLRRRA
jgi:drug/metabolite transporter (DMT)-like permease